ncbi:MAG TPA: class I SAM-dependent methyltransferase [Streptosporangiaceae bacterium]
MPKERTRQLEYSEIQSAMLEEDKRRRKAAKLIAVLTHFLGRADLSGLTVADVGCSAGFISDELATAGAARTVGIDIDVPGLKRAKDAFGERVGFVCSDGERLPFPDGTFDVLVFNHIYEHVVDPDAIVTELHRVLADDGALYLGLGNKYGIIEPHYKLPFLSYLPAGLADRYVRASGRADHYYERFRGRTGLRAMLRDFHVWDYTFAVISEPDRFSGGDDMPGPVARLPRPALRALRPIIPTFLWVATKTPRSPAGPPLITPPGPVSA